MPVQQLLLDSLLDLIDDDFSTFKWYLSQRQLDDCRPIARSQLENAKRTEIVSRLLSSYSTDSAVTLCVLIYQKMCKNSTAQELQQAYAAENSSRAASAVGPAPSAPAGPGALAGPGASAGPGAPAGPWTPAPTMMAQGGSVILAPTVSGGNAGTWTINISK